MDLQGQVAIVTGAGRGIGRATALELARLGADIVVAELDKPGAERTAGEVERASGAARSPCRPTSPGAADLTRDGGADAGAFGRHRHPGEQCRDLPGGVDARRSRKITGTRCMTINAKAVFFASQAVLPTMIAQKSGDDRQPGLDGGQGRKRQQPALQRQQGGRDQHHQEPGPGPRRRRHPGELRLPGLRRDRHVDDRVRASWARCRAWSAEEFTRRRLATVPLGRMERAEDVANVIGFLASSKAGYMTGQAISVDGGLVMH